MFLLVWKDNNLVEHTKEYRTFDIAANEAIRLRRLGLVRKFMIYNFSKKIVMQQSISVI
jgi:hypothetical protein